LLGSPSKNTSKEIQKINRSNITSKITYTMAPRILQKTQKILQSFNFMNQEGLPNGTKNHERKMGENEKEGGEILA